MQYNLIGTLLYDNIRHRKEINIFEGPRKNDIQIIYIFIYTPVLVAIRPNKINLSTALEEELQLVVNCGKKWLLNDQHLSINYHRETFLPVFSMVDAKLQRCNNLCLRVVTFSTDLNWNDYIESITSSNAKKFGLFCRARKVFSCQKSIVHIYKPTIHPGIE